MHPKSYLSNLTCLNRASKISFLVLRTEDSLKSKVYQMCIHRNKQINSFLDAEVGF